MYDRGESEDHAVLQPAHSPSIARGVVGSYGFLIGGGSADFQCSFERSRFLHVDRIGIPTYREEAQRLHI